MHTGFLSHFQFGSKNLDSKDEINKSSTEMYY